jgi:phage FluMu protein Com
VSVQCNTCRDIFETYTELAQHISSAPRKTHKHGRKWAAKLLLKVSQLDKKQDFENRSKLTEQEKQNKREVQNIVQLSGQKAYVNAKCPQCKRIHSESIEIEYARSNTAWKIKDMFMILCGGCRRD